MIPTTDLSYQSKKIISHSSLAKKIELFHQKGKKIGLCTGSFDLLHPGHVAHLSSAKKQCDILVVSIATDAFNDGTHNTSGRPLFSQEVRAFAVSQLKTVDFVTICEDSKEVIKIIKPHVYFKRQDDEKLSLKIIDYIQKLPPI